MSDAQNDIALKKELLKRIRLIDLEIASLSKEKNIIEHKLININKSNNKEFITLNPRSIEKNIIENTIISLLDKRKDSVYGNYLYSEVRKIYPLLKSSTFRSHLHRLHKRNIIKIHSKRGYWILT